jgi:xylulokinase
MLFDFDKREWDDELLSLVGLTKENMPRIVSPLDFVGTVCEAASNDSGLPVGTHVICGATDTAMEVFAAGGVRVGDMTLKLATAGRICVISDGYFPDKNIINYSHVKNGLYYPGSATKSCASSLRWFRDTFGGDFKEFDEMAGKIQPGSDGLIFNPYLLGELTPFANPALRASFIGISASHTKAHFARAVMEGVGYNLEIILQAMRRGGNAIDDLILVGGGARNDTWQQILSDILGLPVRIPYDLESATSMGAAITAGVGVGAFDSFDVAEKFIRIRERREPNHQNDAVYGEMKGLFEDAYRALCPLFEKM